MYYTKGGITFDDAYFSMPVYLRNYYYQQLIETIAKENKKADQPKTHARGKRNAP